MGSTFALDLAGQVDEGTLQLGIAVTHHLQYNHYPPIPLPMVDTCLKAIEHANEGLYDELVPLPKGVTDARSGSTSSSASRIIEAFHLEFFLNADPDLVYEDEFPEDEEEEYGGI